MIQATIPQLGALVADVWVSEEHARELEVTENPIEFGSPITDHAFVKAQVLLVEFGISNSPLASNPAITAEDRIEQVRQQLFDLQTQRQLLDVQTLTGGRYARMLIQSVSWRTDAQKRHAIIFSLKLRELVIVTTAETTYKPPPAEARVSSKVAPRQKRGEKPGNKLPPATGEKAATKTSTSADQQAKADAAAKAEEKVDKRSMLKRLADMIGAKS